MKMKHSIVMVAALAVSVGVQAQSLDEGIKMYNYERYETAKKVLAPMAASNPMANYYLGLSELNLGNKEAAATIFAKYPEHNANKSGAIRVVFAQGNAAEGNKQAADLAKTAKKKDWETVKYAADALTYSTGGDKQQAVNLYKDAQLKNPEADLLVEMGDAYLEIQGGGGQAMTSFEKATEKNPNNSLAYTRIGKLWYDAKKYDDALKNYEKAKEVDPNNPMPYNYLADAYFWVKKLDKSKENQEKYLELSDKTNEDMQRYASTLYLTEDYAKAIQVSNELIAKGVNKPSLYGILAFSYMGMKDSANALTNVRKYMAMQDPKKIGWLDQINYGKILASNGMADSADFYFNKGIEANTAADKSDVYKEIADFYIARKTTEDYLKASQWYGKLAASKTTPAALDYFYWGLYAYYGRDYTTADKAYALMEEKYPDQPSAVYWRGRVAAAQDPEAKEGIGITHYEKWLNFQQENYQRKPADLMYAYQYIALYYYNKDDKAKAAEYVTKVEEIDPNNSFAKQMRDAMKPAPRKG